MKIKLLRPLMVGDNPHQPQPKGTELSLPDHDAQDLIDRQLAVSIGGEIKAAPKPLNKMRKATANK